MVYFVVWVVFLVVCIVAIPVAAVLDKRQKKVPAAAIDNSGFGEQELYEDQVEAEPEDEEDAFAEAQDFPAEEIPEAGEPVLDDFSAFEEEFQ